jgi:hypothetical protein
MINFRLKREASVGFPGEFCPEASKEKKYLLFQGSAGDNES